MEISQINLRLSKNKKEKIDTAACRERFKQLTKKKKKKAPKGALTIDCKCLQRKKHIGVKCF